MRQFLAAIAAALVFSVTAALADPAEYPNLFEEDFELVRAPDLALGGLGRIGARCGAVPLLIPACPSCIFP